MSAPLTTRIPIRDRNGNIVDEKEVATYAGLLSRAHEEGLRSIRTDVLQYPSDGNGQTVVVLATVETDKGTFTGIGDANPDNVNRKIAAHIIRMAETRAKARALRDAVNIGTVALEELGGDEDVDERPAPHSERPRLRAVSGERTPENRPAPQSFPRGNDRRGPQRHRRTDSRDAPMTENQRRWLYRFLAERGFEGQAATDALCHAAEVQGPGQISKALASQLIDAWKQDQGEGGHAA